MSESDRKPPDRATTLNTPATRAVAPVRRSGAYTRVDASPGGSKHGNDLAAAIHDLRNLLFVISSSSEAAIADASPGTEMFEGLTDIGAAAARAIHVVEEIAHRDASMSSASTSVIDVDEVICAFLSILRRQGGARARVTFEPGAGEVRARIDRHALEHALLNLVVNAVDAIVDVGTVTILSERDEEVVRITVTDNGAGMDATTLARAFEPRFTTRAGVGRSGLGLATVRELIGAAGGQVSATSRPGFGSIVVIELPADSGDGLAFDA